MAKQLNVSLGFTADTSQAKQAIIDLSKELQEISSLGSNISLTKDMQSAVSAAKDLQTHLNNAFNTKTNNFDLSELEKSLKRSGQSLSDLSNKLLGAGNIGEKAFISLSNSISKANINLTKSQGLLSSFITTLKNTARWQLSSSMMHGFMGAIQTAISYAESLDKSLNDIRIVTGDSSEQMAKFAAQANKAAQSLSTTTTAYTNASLIFYQQGLDNEAVKERTDTVIKMSNVTGDSAEDVSSYMTAIWENFYDGSKSLEYYADVITRLGADTAASSAEIAEGIESFASIGETIGLSYEYATSALTTIVAKTRASASEVGNGLRTIFSRLQNLSLGETLEDGTDLTKYTKALATVGVDVKDASGELKDMDTILEDLASKWDTLDQAEKVALANTVGGVRQYTKLISLMDNWDFMEENLASASNSEGSLQEQADIYEESWAAAQKRVKASLQAVYTDLIPTDAIIKMTDGFATVINIVDKVIDSFGGLKSIILLIATITVNKFQANIASAIDTTIFKVKELGTSIATFVKNGMFSVKNITSNIGKVSKNADSNALANAGQGQIQNYEEKGKSNIQKDYTKALNDASERQDVTAGFSAQIKNLQTIDKLQSKIQVNAKSLTEEERAKLELQLEEVQALGEQEAKLIDQQDILRYQLDNIKDKDRDSAYNDIENSENESKLTVGEDTSRLNEVKAQIEAINNAFADERDKVEIIQVQVETINEGTAKQASVLRLVVNSEEDIITLREKALDLVSDTSSMQTRINSAIRQGAGNLDGQKKAILSIINEEKKLGHLTEEQAASISKATKNCDGSEKGFKRIRLEVTKVVNSSKQMATTMGSSKESIDAAANAGTKMGQTILEVATASERTKNAIEQVENAISNAAQRTLSFSGTMSSAISNLTSFAMAASQITNFVNNLQDPDVSWTQKLMSGAMAASASLAFLNTTAKGLQTIMAALNAVQSTGIAISTAKLVVDKTISAEDAKATAVKAAKIAMQRIAIRTTEEEAIQEGVANLVKETGMSTDKAAALIKVLLSGAKNTSATASTVEGTAEEFDTLAKEADTGATIALTLAEYGLSVPLLIVMGILIAMVAVIAAVVSIINKHNEVAEEARQASIDAGKAAKEEADANKELINTYEEAYKVYKETGEGKQDLVDAAAAVCEAYDIEGAALAELTGDYEALTEAIREARLAELEGTEDEPGVVEDLEAAKNAAGGSFEAAMREGKGYKSGDKYYAGRDYGWSKGDGDDTAANIIQEGDYSHISAAGDSMSITADFNAEDLAAAYEEAKDALDEMNRSMTDEERASSEYYKYLNDWVSKSAEQYEAYQEAVDNLNEAETEALFLQNQEDSGIKPEDIDSVSEYIDYRQQLIDKLKEQRGIEETDVESDDYKQVESDIDNILSNDTYLSTFSQVNKALDEASEKTGIASKNLKEFYDNLDEDEQEVFFSIDFDTIHTEEDLKQAIAKVQALADEEEIELKVSTVKTAKENLSEDMSAEDYTNYKTESGIDWGEDGVIEYSEFLSKNYEEQVQYLTELEEEYLNKQQSAIAETIEANKTLLDNYQTSAESIKTQLESEDDPEKKADLQAQLDAYNDLIDQLIQENNELTQKSQLIYQDSINNITSNITSLHDLDAIIGQMELDQGHFDESYTQNLIALGEGYESCAGAVEKYQQALTQLAEEGNEATDATKALVEEAEDELRAIIELEEAAEKYDLEADSLTAQAKELRNASKDVNGEMTLSAEQAAELAVQNQRLNKGLTKLVDGWSDWKKVLQSTDKTSQDYADTLVDLSKAVTDLVGWYEDLALDSEFVADNMDLIEKSSTGDTTAIMRLGAAVANYTVSQAELNTTLAEGQMSDGTLNALQKYAETLGEGVTTAQAFAAAQSGVQAGFDTIASNMERLQNGATLAEVFGSEEDLANWVQQLNAYAAATGMTAQEMQDMLSSVGVTANVQTDWQEQDVEVPTYVDVVEEGATVRIKNGTDENGNPLYQEVQGYKRYSVPGEPMTAKGYVEVASISMDGEGESPSVSAPTFIGKQAPSSSAKKGSSNSGGSGGSGGSSKSTEHNDEDYKNYTDEKERYHVIKNQLEDLTSQYDRISSAKDKAFGTARLANLNKEIAAQKKLTQANKQYLDEIENYLAQDKGTMAAYGAVFDENGTITNYDAIVKKQVNAYNQAVSAYNAAYTDDEGAKAAFEAAQERYDDFQDALSQYEETQDLFKEQTQTYIDSLNAEREKLLERTQLQVELKVNVEEDALNFLEYALDNIENKAYDCAEAFGYLNDMTIAYLGTASAYEEGLRSLFANQGLSNADFDKFISGNTATVDKVNSMLSNGESAGFQEEDVETIRDYLQELISVNESLQETRQTVHEQILTAWDEWNEKLDNSIEKLEHLQAIQESYVNIVDIVGQKNLGVSNAFMKAMAQQGIDQANDKLIAEKARYEALKQARDDAYAKFEEQQAKGILSEEEIQQWEESLQQMDEDVQSASEDFQSAWEDALTSIGEAFEAEIDRIIAAYDDAAAGLMSSMSQLQDAFDRKSDLADQYLDDYEKIYQFSKLNRDIENSIDSTDNVKAKKELLELQSKINAYEEAGTDISEYELQQLQQEYELKKAQIELEESQEAKSQVRMQRDSEGNYSYVYTANDEDVSKAEQNYEDKLHDMQQSNAEYINDLQSNMVQMEQDYQDKVQEIMTDTSLTAEERMVQLNDLTDYYNEKMKFYISEAELWEQNSQTLYEQDWANYAAATGYKISSEDEWLDHWNETLLSLLTGFDELEDYQTNHNSNVADLLLASSEAFSTWQVNIEEAMNNAGTSIGTFEEDATDSLNSVAEQSEETKDQMVSDAEEIVGAIEEVTSAVVKWEDEYSQAVQKMLNYNTSLIKSFNATIAAWAGFKEASDRNSSSSSSNSSSSSSSSSSSGSGANGSGNGSSAGSSNASKVEGVAAAIWMDGSSTSGWGTGATRRQRLQEKGVSDAQAYINAHAANGEIYAAWHNRRSQLKQYYYGSFDTGGYTGEWGLGGKLALLHEKEIVLNADDTKNFLQAVDVVRQISDMIDLNALSSAGGFTSLLASSAVGSQQDLQQDVHITAEFPNATDKDQITEAFSDLINLASQYANRK